MPHEWGNYRARALPHNMKAIKNVRLKYFDYSYDGFYFVTIVTDQRKPLLLDRNKEVVAQFIGRLAETPGVSVDYCVIMTNHVHMILIFDGCKLKLGEVVRRFKARTKHALGVRLWQPNYYEHIIRNEKALLRIREYIQKNPEAEKIKWESIYYDLTVAGKKCPINRATTDTKTVVARFIEPSSEPSSEPCAEPCPINGATTTHRMKD